MSAVVDFPVRPEARAYVEAFAPPSGEPEWLTRQRRRSLARFAERGFPSRRGESWRYIDLRALAERPLPPVPADPSTVAASSRLDGMALPGPTLRLVLVDGHFAAPLSAIEELPAGVRLLPMMAAVAQCPQPLRGALDASAADSSSFAALNTAFFTDGFVLEAAPGVVVDRPVEIVHLALNRARASLHTRSLVRLGAGSNLTLVESFAGEGECWRNDVVEVELAEGAALSRVAIIEEAGEALHFGDSRVRLDRRARYSQFDLLIGGRTVRREIAVRMAGRDAHCRLGGAYLLDGRQEGNIVTSVAHAAPGGETRELFKGVAAGRAHGAFQGRITVEPGAQKTDAHLLSRNLLLGARAAIDTKPELEIFADDVKCSHGAAVGDLDEAALFYLLARGIPPKAARRMLIEAFLREPVEDVATPLLREHLLTRLARRLARMEEQE
jgi:Fe-S cluster assembly protein SufD